ncbi:MAG TPA: LuxR C-terminal-related transcriptional regulator, partial [Pseudonocardiaceae bacterium]|nr:LuxR C-terminal-related transcriptional regulator [Pseudonocardiaceae bacterium]
AAVRLRALSLEQIVERLADRCNLLAAGKGAPARQRTLGALMGWSFDLCTPDEQLLWMRLSVFSGGIELKAAEGVCADERITRPDVLGLLISLVDKSILMREESDGRVRYRLLETVREFGQAKLRESGELLEWRRRHRDWYLELVDYAISRWMTAGQSERLELLRRDHANLRAALDFCLGQPGEVTAGLHMAGTLYFYWLMGGLINEGRHWIDLMLTAGTDPSQTRARALVVRANLATLGGDLAVAERMFSQALEEAGDIPQIRAAVGQGRGLLAVFGDDLVGAIEHYEEALRTYEHADDDTGEAFTLFLYGLAVALHGDSDKAQAAHRRCQELTESRGEVWIWSCSMYTVGVDAWLRGDHAEAMRLQRAALLMKRPLIDYIGIAECIESIAWIEASTRRHLRAATLFGASDTTWREVGMPMSVLPEWRRHRESCVRLAQAIGKRPFEAAYREGARMSLEEAVAFALEETKPATAADDPSALTPRELEISELIGQGLSNGDIATTLVLSRRTVEAHVQHLMAKLNFTSRTQVAAWVAGKAGDQPTLV